MSEFNDMCVAAAKLNKIVKVATEYAEGYFRTTSEEAALEIFIVKMGGKENVIDYIATFGKFNEIKVGSLYIHLDDGELTASV